MTFSPLEQFEIVSLIKIPYFFIDISFSNISFYCITILLIMGTVVKIFGISNINIFIKPSFVYLGIEHLFLSSLVIVKENLGNAGKRFSPFFFFLFSFLILGNVVGLVPFSFTITAQFIITLSLSYIVWVGKLILGFYRHGIHFFSILLPGGIPFAIVPFFVFVELISFFIPLVALGVRLFANIMSGHILIKVIASFCWMALFLGSGAFLVHFILIGMLFLLMFLETAVAFIQAYVFFMLSCLYFGDAIKGGHL
ncbi:ATP synthase F0 subunit A [PVC group bacterium (ex Bugula neritina AB1)]|nr:ATP synthase F0 subunit A [PVC group bacterium (ex Bugula neritina AB1)]